MSAMSDDEFLAEKPPEEPLGEIVQFRNPGDRGAITDMLKEQQRQPILYNGQPVRVGMDLQMHRVGPGTKSAEPSPAVGQASKKSAGSQLLSDEEFGTSPRWSPMESLKAGIEDIWNRGWQPEPPIVDRRPQEFTDSDVDPTKPYIGHRPLTTKKPAGDFDVGRVGKEAVGSGAAFMDMIAGAAGQGITLMNYGIMRAYSSLVEDASPEESAKWSEAVAAELVPDALYQPFRRLLYAAGAGKVYDESQIAKALHSFGNTVDEGSEALAEKYPWLRPEDTRQLANAAMFWMGVKGGEVAMAKALAAKERLQKQKAGPSAGQGGPVEGEYVPRGGAVVPREARGPIYEGELAQPTPELPGSRPLLPAPEAPISPNLPAVIAAGGAGAIAGLLTGDEDEATIGAMIGATMGSKKGTIKADTGRLIDLLGSSMYMGNIANVTVKELLQNSFDAIKAAKIKDGKIDITIDPRERTISVSDNGRGMTPEIVEKAFFTIGGTDKSGLSPKERSGGLGLAKMAFLFGSEHVIVESTRNGVRTRVEADSDTIRNGSFDIETTSVKGAPNGTTVTVKIPESYMDPRTGEPRQVGFPYNPTHVDILQKPLIGDVDIRVKKNRMDPGTTLPMGRSMDKTSMPKFTTAKFDWGTADVYVGKKRTEYPKHHVLSSGLYQFSGDFKIGGTSWEKIPYDIIVDVKPDVEPTHPAYPFNNQREGWRGTIQSDIEALEKYFQQMHKGTELQQTKEAFKNAVKMPRINIDFGEEMFDQRFMERARRAFEDLQRNKGKAATAEVVDPIWTSPEFIDILNGGVFARGKELLNERSQKASFQADRELAAREDFMTEGFDTDAPILHNNTNVDYVGVLKSTFPESKPEELLSAFGSLVMKFKEEIAELNQPYGIDKLKDDYAVGVSIDKDYRGVHIRVPYKAFFINPLALSAQTVGQFGREFLTTLLHEATHTVNMDHNENFILSYHALEAELAREGRHRWYEDAAMMLADRYWDTLLSMRDLYNESLTRNIAKSIDPHGAHLGGPPRLAAPDQGTFLARQGTGDGGNAGSGGGNEPPRGPPGSDTTAASPDDAGELGKILQSKFGNVVKPNFEANRKWLEQKAEAKIREYRNAYKMLTYLNRVQQMDWKLPHDMKVKAGGREGIVRIENKEQLREMRDYYKKHTDEFHNEMLKETKALSGQERVVPFKPKGEGGAISNELLGKLAVAAGLGAVGAYLAKDDKIAFGMLGALAGLWLTSAGGRARASGAVLTAKDLALPMDVRLGEIHPAIKLLVRQYDLGVLENAHIFATRVVPFMKLVENMPEAQFKELSKAVLTGDKVATDRIVASSPELQQAWRETRQVLDGLGRAQYSYGQVKKLVDDYFPRRVKDYEGLLRALGSNPIRTVIESELRKAEAKARVRGRPLSAFERDRIINSRLSGYYSQQGHVPGYALGRTIDKITDDLLPFYHSINESLFIRIKEGITDLEMARFFGRDHVQSRGMAGQAYTNVPVSVGNLVGRLMQEGKVTPEKFHELERLLQARFGPGELSASKGWQEIRNLTNLALLGNPESAATQLGDIFMPMYKTNVQSTIVALARSVVPGARKITPKDLGLADHIAEEFVTGGTADAVNRTFKVVGFTGVDQLGKSTLLNASLDFWQRQVKTERGTRYLAERYLEAFGPGRFRRLLRDLRTGRVSPDVRLLTFSELADMQPLTKTGTSVLYQEHPNFRYAATMKTFAMKQLGVVYEDGYLNIKKGIKEKKPLYVARGLKNIAAYGIVLGIGGATSDTVKDAIMFRKQDTELGDVAENILKTFGASQYVREEAERKGPVRAYLGGLVPPVQIADEAWMGMTKGDPKIWSRFPIVGKHLYGLNPPYGMGGNAKQEVRKAEKNKRLGKDTVLSPAAERYIAERNRRAADKRQATRDKTDEQRRR